MDVSEIKVVALDLDGTLTQHKTKLSPEHKEVLDRLSGKYKLLIVGAGDVRRIFQQLNRYPVDILGNYGMQYAEYNPQTSDIHIIRDLTFGCREKEVEQKITALRVKYGFTEFAGENTEFHSSGCITFPLLGTKAQPEDKLNFDPDRSKRRDMYHDVLNAFPDYCVFIGGSSSFDMAPKPYNKYYALDCYCKEKGYHHYEVVFIGDDYGLGGNDESVYNSDFPYLTIDNYLDFPKVVSAL